MTFQRARKRWKGCGLENKGATLVLGTLGIIKIGEEEKEEGIADTLKVSSSILQFYQR